MFRNVAAFILPFLLAGPASAQDWWLGVVIGHAPKRTLIFVDRDSIAVLIKGNYRTIAAEAYDEDVTQSARWWKSTYIIDCSTERLTQGFGSTYSAYGESFKDDGSKGPTIMLSHVDVEPENGFYFEKAGANTIVQLTCVGASGITKLSGISVKDRAKQAIAFLTPEK